MKKKILLLLLVIAILICAASCGAAKTPDATATPEASAEPTDTPEPSFDLEARNITIASWWDPTPAERGTSTAADELRAVIESLEKKYNFTFKWIQGDAWGTDYTSNYSTTVMGGTCWADVAYIDNRWFFPDMVCKDLFYPISEIDAINLEDTDKWAEVATSFGTYKGSVFATELNDFQPRYMMFFDPTMYSKLNLTNLHDRIDDKSWTWDQFKADATALVEKDSEGNTTRYGVGGGAGLVEALIFTNGGSIVSFDDNGQPYFSMNSPEAIAACDLYAQLRESNVWVNTETYETWEDDFASGKTALLGAQWYMHGNVEEANPEKMFSYMYLPIGPTKSEYISAASNYNLITMPSTIEDVQEVGYIYNIYTNRTATTQTIENRTDAWETSTQEARSVDVIFSIAKGDIKSYSTWITCFSSASTTVEGVFTKLSKGTVSATEGVEGISAKVNAILTDLMSEYTDWTPSL